MKKIIEINTSKLFTNITDECKKFVTESNFKDGVLNIHTPHTTSGIFITEDELLHLVDVRFFLDKVAPKFKEPEGDQKNIKYLHDIISLRKVRLHE